MHAARAIHKQRERREEKKLQVRRPSATSSRFPHSPAVSIDAAARRPRPSNDDERFNFSYVGFVVAGFGAVPLLVGTFVDVPALWEIGLGVTLVGIFIGLVFWCTELCAEAKKFSQKKKKLSSRGKIEDSNLLQVPDKKFNHANGVTSESRRGSLCDSVSLISPAAQLPSQNHLSNHHGKIIKPEDSISQYSASEVSKSSSTTLHPTARANGHALPVSDRNHRSGRKTGDGRIVSLVQHETGLDDDSDSDAETVIEAPTGGTKIIQVQSCQEKSQQRPNLFKGDSLGSVVDSKTINSTPSLMTSYSLEDETIGPLVPKHRTIRMPVMPHEVDKLKKCECGRFLLDSDKIITYQQQNHHGSSVPSTTFNSPAWSMGPNPSRKVFGVGTTPSSNHSSGNDVSSSSDHQTMSVIPENTKIISVNPSAPASNSVVSIKSIKSSRLNTSTASITDIGESVVQVDPSLSHSTANLLKTENMSKSSVTLTSEKMSVESDFGSEEIIKTFQEVDKDKELTELLELTDDSQNLKKALENSLTSLQSTDLNSDQSPVELETQKREVIDKTEVIEVEPNDDQFSISEKKETALQNNRPTSLALPSQPGSGTNIQTDNSSSSVMVMSPTSSSSASTVISTEASSASKDTDDSTLQQLLSEDFGEKRNELLANKEETTEGKSIASPSAPTPTLTKDISLDELLDRIEQKQEIDGMTVVAQ